MKGRHILLVVLLLVAVCLVSCGIFESIRTQEYSYYLDTNNYIESEGTVNNIIYNKDLNTIFLWLSDIDEEYQDTTFAIKGDSVNVAIENGILDEVEEYSKITFISAPKYFGDGYIMPIVSLYIDDVCLLDFDTGYNNLINMY